MVRTPSNNGLDYPFTADYSHPCRLSVEVGFQRGSPDGRTMLPCRVRYRSKAAKSVHTKATVQHTVIQH